MRITLDRNSSTPLSKQICIRIRELILSGELKNGERLPSTRIMAKELKINRATVAQAYKELIHEGLVHSGVGSGTYISYHAFDNHDELDQSNYIPQLSEGIHSLWRTSMEGLDFKLVPEDTVNFATLIPDENLDHSGVNSHLMHGFLHPRCYVHKTATFTCFYLNRFHGFSVHRRLIKKGNRQKEIPIIVN